MIGECTCFGPIVAQVQMNLGGQAWTEKFFGVTLDGIPKVDALEEFPIAMRWRELADDKSCSLSANPPRCCLR